MDLSQSFYFDIPQTVCSTFINNDNHPTRTAVNGEISILYINIVSLRSKLHDLELFIQSFAVKPDIIALTEIRITNDEIPFFNIENYNSVFSCRAPNVNKKSGGGVGLLISNKFKYNIIKRADNNFDNLLLINLLEIKLNIGIVYTPPDANKDNFIEILEQYLTNAPTIILGDVNMNLLNPSAYCIKYLDTIISSNYFILNNVNKDYPTRLYNNSIIEGTIIDHIISNIEDIKYSLQYQNTYLSDHKLLHFIMNCTTSTKKAIETPKSIPIINYNKIQTYLQNHPLTIQENTDLQMQTEIFITSLQDIVSKFTTQFIPVQTNSFSNKPWISSEIIALIKSKNKLYNYSKTHPNNIICKQKLKDMSNLITKLKRRNKLKYFSQFTINTNDPRKCWRSLNAIIYNKSTQLSDPLPSLISDPDDSSLIYDNVPKIIDVFNTYFSKIGNSVKTSINHNSLPIIDTEIINNNSNMYMFLTNRKEILEIIKNLKNNASSGIDKLSSKLLKNCCNELVNPILALVNNMLKEGIFPNVLKIGRVIPIYKSGDKLLCSNYRPITVLPILSKIFEKVIYNRIHPFLNSIDFITPHQYGFCNGSNTETATINVLNEVQKGLDNSKEVLVGLLFIDLVKAFDTVDHSLIINKLNKIGIKGNSLKLIKSYLDNRVQIIKYKSYTSSAKPVTCGIPQGGILSPILFNIFINDIVNLPLKGKLSLYADDICLIYISDNIITIISDMAHDLQLLNNWLTSNLLCLNASKTKYLIISSKYNKPKEYPTLFLNKAIIERVDSYKYLGLYIDSSLSWDVHINHIKSKLLPAVGVIKRLKYDLPSKSKLLIYFSLIHSHLTYLNAIWGTAAKKYINPLQILQNKAIKHVYSWHFRTPTKYVYANCNILSFQNLKRFNLLKFIYKLKNGLIKSQIAPKLNNEIHNYQTRTSLLYHIDPIRTNFGKFAVLNEAIHLFNSIPKIIREEPQFNRYKILLKNYFLEEQKSQQNNI